MSFLLDGRLDLWKYSVGETWPTSCSWLCLERLAGALKLRIRKNHMTNINDVIANELVRRVRKLSTEELLSLAKNTVAVKRRAASKSGVHRLELAKPVESQVTINDAIVEATMKAKKALSTAEIVDGAKAIRPDAQEATIRAGISKLAAAGVLHRQGPRVGGTYTKPAVAKTA